MIKACSEAARLDKSSTDTEGTKEKAKLLCEELKQQLEEREKGEKKGE